jgi:hypothetical protein
MRNCASADAGASTPPPRTSSWGARTSRSPAGTEAMSRAPVLLNERMVNWLADLNAAARPAGAGCCAMLTPATWRT